MTVAKLMEEGVSEVVIDSSGNAALSFALYSLPARIRVHTFVSYDAMPAKISLLQRLGGAVIHFVDGGDRMEVHKEAIEFAKREGITYVTHWLNLTSSRGGRSSSPTRPTSRLEFLTMSWLLPVLERSSSVSGRALESLGRWGGR